MDITVRDLSFDGPAFLFKLPQNVTTSVTFKVRHTTRIPAAPTVRRRELHARASAAGGGGSCGSRWFLASTHSSPVPRAGF